MDTPTTATIESERSIGFWEEYGALLAFPVALAATLGSLYYSEVAGYIPCTLCWYQRILMYPLALLIPVGLILRDEFLPRYVLPLSTLGIVIASYHYLTQWGLFAESAACRAGVPCSGRYVNHLGFITIPFMALIAFTLITIIMFLVWRASRPEGEGATAV